MTNDKQFGELVTTQDGSVTIRNPEINEEYHSHCGALGETYELYLKRSGFLAALQQHRPLVVLDVGLGLGYNAIAAIEAWLKADKPGPLTLVSLEKQASLVSAIANGNGSWCSHWPSHWSDLTRHLKPITANEWQCRINHDNGASLAWTVLIGDGAQTPLPNLGYNFVFQDAFSPKKNPELWSQDWFHKVRSCAATDCTLVTYSVARMVKDNLESSGWTYKKIPAPGAKKHWLAAHVR